MKKGKIGILIFFAAIGLFTIFNVFAEYSNEYGTHVDDDLLRYCNRQTAYSTGVSDARKGLARKEDFARICRVDRAQLRKDCGPRRLPRLARGSRAAGGSHREAVRAVPPRVRAAAAWTDPQPGSRPPAAARRPAPADRAEATGDRRLR